MFFAVSVITYNKGHLSGIKFTGGVGVAEIAVDEHILIVDSFSDEAARAKAVKFCKKYMDGGHHMMGTGRDIAGARRAVKDFDVEGILTDGRYYSCHSFVLDASRYGEETVNKLLHGEPVNVWSPTGISTYEEGLNDIRRFTDETPSEKLTRIDTFMYNFARNIKSRTHMFGSVELIEGFYTMFDSVFNIINGISEEDVLSMNDYYIESGRHPDYTLDDRGLSSQENLKKFMSLRDDYIMWQSEKLGISENFFMGNDEEAEEIIAKIHKFIDDFMEQSKKDPESYGTPEVLERKWEALDKFWFILQGKHYKGVPFSTINYPPDYSFGEKTYAMVAKERNPYNPYLELLNIRDAYESWRSNKMQLATRRGE